MSRPVPIFPVRHNRTNMLRTVFSVHTDNLKHLIHPPLSEFGSPVRGKNKSVAKKVQKHVTRWFKDQTIYVDTISKRQEHAYDNLLRLEKERIELQTKASQASVRLAPIKSPKEEVPEIPQKGTSVSGVRKPKSKRRQRAKPLPDWNIPTINKDVNKLKPIPELRKMLSTEKEEATTNVKSLSVPYFKRGNVIAERVTSSEDSQGQSQGQTQNMSIERNDCLTEDQRSELSREPVTHYVLGQNGIVYPLQAPYKKKVFQKPKKQETNIHDSLLQQEQLKKREHQKRFKKLSSDLDVLGE